MTGAEKARRLQRALDYSGPTHRMSDVVDLLKAGKAQLWEQGDGCIITELHEYPLFKSVHYWLISGALADCLALEHTINPWAVELGCTLATASGRKGWGRVAAPTGWKSWHPSFYKPLVTEAADGQ